jgi:hypothetical protein
VVWFHPAREQLRFDIGIKDHAVTRGVNVFFVTPLSGMQHVFILTETFTETCDEESGEIRAFAIK